MKRILALILALAMCLSACYALVACGDDDHTHSYVDGKCECGATDPSYKPDDDKGGIDFGDLLPDLTFESTGVIIKNLAINTGDSLTEFENLALYISADENGLSGYGNGKVTVTNSSTETADVTFILENNVLYIQAADDDNKISLNVEIEKLIGSLGAAEGSMLGSIEEMIEALESGAYDDEINALVSIVSEKFIPALGDLNGLLPTDEDVALVAGLFEAFASNFIKVEAVDGGSKVSLDLSVLNDWFAAFKTMKGSELIDLVFGEGTFASIKETIPAILAFSVEDLVAIIVENGGNLDTLEEGIDALLVYSGAPAGMNFKALMAQTFGAEMSLKQLLALDEIKSISVDKLLSYLFVSLTNKPSAYSACENCHEDIGKNQVDILGETFYVCDSCYEKIMSSGSTPTAKCCQICGADGELFDYEGTLLCAYCYKGVTGDTLTSDTVEEIPSALEMISGILDAFEAVTLPELFELSEDTLAQIEASLLMATSTVSLDVTFDADGNAKSFYYALDMSEFMENSPAYSLTVDKTASGAKVTIDANMGGSASMGEGGSISGEIEIAVGAKGEKDTEALASIKKDLAEAKALIYKDYELLDAMIVNGVLNYSYGTAKGYESTHITDDAGKNIGIAVNVVLFDDEHHTEGQQFYVYYEDLFALQVMTEDDDSEAMGTFFATYGSYSYDKDNGSSSADNYTATINIEFEFDNETGEIYK